MKVKRKSEGWQPTAKNLNLINTVIGQLPAESAAPSGWLLKYCNSHKYRLAYDLDQIDAFSQAGKPEILEVGAMPFILTLALQKKGLNVTGVDLEPGRMQTVIHHNSLNVVQCDIEREALPFNDNTFDMVIFNEVFEHLRINPIHTIREMYRVIRPDGKLLLSTPNLLSLKGWISLVLKNKTHGSIFHEYLKLSTVGHMGHVREYTPVEVCEFLHACGFSVEEIIYRGLPVSKSKLKQTLARLFLTAFPRLRRYFTVVAKKVPLTANNRADQPLPY